LVVSSQPDETITVFDLPGGACPSQTCYNLVANTHDMPDVLTNKFGIARVVIAMKEINPRGHSLDWIVGVSYSVTATPRFFLAKRGI
jgi:hypothetical protein